MSDLGSFSPEEVKAILDREEKLYAPVEVAFILGLQQATVQDLCRAQKLRAFKVHMQWRIPKSEISRYIEKGPYQSGERGST